MSKHILIIGGMGPQASVYAQQRVVELAAKNGAINNDEYPRITHLSINVKDFISNPSLRNEAKRYIIDCLQEVDTSSADSSFIACNTAHLLFDDIKKNVGKSLFSIIELTKEHTKNMPNVGIIATPSTIKTNLYGITSENLIPDEESLAILENIIREVVSGTEPIELVDTLNKEIKKLTNNGAERVILGCTELSMFGKYLDQSVILDPIDISIRKALS